MPILHVIAKSFPNQWHKIGDNANTVRLATVEKLIAIFRIFITEYSHVPTRIRNKAEDDDGVVDGSTQPKVTIYHKHIPTTSGSDNTYKIHIKF